MIRRGRAFHPSPNFHRAMTCRAWSLLVVGLILCGPVALSLRASHAGAQKAEVPSGSSSQEPFELQSGVPIERELAGGESHRYRLRLDAGQYVHVVVEQRGIDVVVVVLAPEGTKLVEMDSPTGTQGSESVSWVAAASGEYRLEVRALEKEARPGRYEIRVEEWREATPQDEKRVAAERAFAEAELLRARGTAESLRKAIEKYKETLPLWQAVGDRKKEAEALHSIGFIYSLLGENRKAIEYFNQALPLFGMLGDFQAQAATLTNIGAAYARLGENRKALSYMEQALPLRRRAGDRQGEAATLNNIGIVYARLGEPQKALEYYMRALPILRVIGDRRWEARTLHNIGTVYMELGELEKALEYFNQALPISRAMGDRRGEATTLNSIGMIYANTGEPGKALEYFNQALPISRAMGDRRGEATTLNNIGKVYSDLGEPEKALEYYRQALSISRAVGDRGGEAATLTNIGGIYAHLGEPEKALEYFNRALPIHRAVGDRRMEATTLSNIGVVYARLGELEKALEYFNRALPIHRAVGDRGGEATTLNNIGGIYAHLGEPEKALEYCNQALSILRAVGDRNGEATTLGNIAGVERSLGHLAEARSRIEEALRIIESLRTRVISPELRATFLASRLDFYEFYIDLLMQMHRREPTRGYDALALQASERARARSLLEMLVEARADIRQGVDPELLARERRVQQRLNARERYRLKLLGGRHTEAQLAAVEREVRALLDEYRQVEAEIRARSPKYAALTQPEPLSVKEMQAEVLDEGTVLLEYALGRERSFLWAVTKDSVRSYELPPRSEIEAVARRVYEGLRGSRERLAWGQVRLAAARLSRMILGPVADQLAGKRLVVVSEGALQYVPFGALPEPGGGESGAESSIIGGEPLLVHHEVVSVPSASVVAVVRREVAGRRPAAHGVAVLADPVFDKEDERVKAAMARRGAKGDRSSSSRPFSAAGRSVVPSDVERSAREVGMVGFARLPFTRREAEAIMGLVVGEGKLEALDFRASRALVKSPELGRYRIVHLATHGLLNSRHPELSGLVFSLVDERGRAQDGFLRLHEVYNLAWGADLVVLSACQTALGREVRGEGLVGLTRGFMYAGVPRVVVSLWAVSDEATAVLMERFYEGMFREGLRPVEALRRAQEAVRREGRWRAPYYWAGFVLQGEWR